MRISCGIEPNRRNIWEVRMDKLSAKAKGRDKEKKEGFIHSFVAKAKDGISKARSRETAIIDLFVFLLSFLVSRGHLVFGARPLGIAFVSVLPKGVWIAALGAVAGSLSLGKSGIIYAMISVIVVFLRVIVSGTDKSDSSESGAYSALFTESLILRMSAALIGGFIAGLYEVLLSGFTLSTVLFGVSMVLIPPVTVFALSGLFEGGYSPREVIFGAGSPLTRALKSEKQKMSRIFFECSALTLVFLLGLCLKEYVLLGISASYVFSGIVTVFAAKRFGAVKAAVLSFFSSLGVSSTAAVAFSLGGIASGVLFTLGALPALVGAGVALSAWGYYTEGLVGLVALLPEYCIGAAATIPLLNKLTTERAPKEAEKEEKIASEMVGTVTISYKNKFKGSLDSLESALYSVSNSIEEYKKKSYEITKEDLRRILTATLDEFFSEDSTYSDHPFVSDEILDNLTTILYKNGRITPSDADVMPLYPYTTESYSEAVNRAISLLERDRHKDISQSLCEDIPIVAKLINESRLSDEYEKATDDARSDSLTKMLSERGLDSVSARVVGKRKRHVIVACHDPDGTRVTDPELIREIEKELSSTLSRPEYYRKGDIALFESTVCPQYTAEYAVAAATGEKSSVSGDSADFYESPDGFFFSVLADGMGSGEDAMHTSRFTVDFMKKSLALGTGRESVLKLLNNALRQAKDESSVTLDLFSLDLYTCEAAFIKSGAAPSYLKRDSSIFRIRSKTAPLGLFPTVDAERIKVSVESGDYIIMLSDGVAAESEGWLPEVLSKPAPKSVKEFAEKILSCARKHSPASDDMTVLVTRIIKKRSDK